jgi:hypothetical protein
MPVIGLYLNAAAQGTPRAGYQHAWLRGRSERISARTRQQDTDRGGQQDFRKLAGLCATRQSQRHSRSTQIAPLWPGIRSNAGNQLAAHIGVTRVAATHWLATLCDRFGRREPQDPAPVW